MTTPRVSVCLPNLNTLPYLQERVDTILGQTYTNWELIVSDNYSDDGAWPFFEKLARKDARVRVAQAPREGMYANWNRCIRRAQGEFIYVATSDDTMAPDCLERLVAALDAHPECDLAHCRLKAIDQDGRNHTATMEWWSQALFAESSGSLLDTAHVRKAPFDGMLHLGGASVYTSITQLLIRRALLDRIGLFEPAWGSVGDFNWCMRAGLVANTVHVPDTWGGWRIHALQATAAVSMASSESARKVEQMIDHAIETSRDLFCPAVRELVGRSAQQARTMRAFRREVAEHQRHVLPRRAAFIVRRALSGSAPARTYLKSRLLGRSWPQRVQRSLDETGLGPVLVPVTATRSSPLRGPRKSANR